MSEVLTSPLAISQSYLATKPPGRFSEISDPDVLQTLYDATEAGLSPTSACEAAGISANTWHAWMKRADDDLSPTGAAYRAFRDDIKRLRRQGQLKILGRISRASELPQHWTAGAWLLERLDQEQFALKKDQEQVQKVIVQIGVSSNDLRVMVSTKTEVSPCRSLDTGESEPIP